MIKHTVSGHGPLWRTYHTIAQLIFKYNVLVFLFKTASNVILFIKTAINVRTSWKSRFEHCFYLMNGRKVYVSVDRTGIKIYEPTPLDTKWVSNKFNGPGIRYEVSISLRSENILSANGLGRSNAVVILTFEYFLQNYKTWLGLRRVWLRNHVIGGNDNCIIPTTVKKNLKAMPMPEPSISLSINCSKTSSHFPTYFGMV